MRMGVRWEWDVERMRMRWGWGWYDAMTPWKEEEHWSHNRVGKEKGRSWRQWHPNPKNV